MTYDNDFFIYNTPIALRAARAVLPGVIRRTQARSVIDIGCSAGAWLSVAKEHGCKVHGVDGFVPVDQLVIDPSEFEQRDLAGGVDCTGYDLAMCLEVAEHLDPADAEPLVEGLCKAKYVLFSPAHPGQGGVHHVNEQWGTWWEKLFSEYHYVGSSDLKWFHWTNTDIHDYYRENLLIFANHANLSLMAEYRPGVVDVIHPERLGTWP